MTVKILSFFVIIFAATSVTSCGPRKVTESGSSDLASRPDPGTRGNPPSGSINHGLLTHCNAVNDSTTQTHALLETFVDPMSGQYIPNYVRVFFADYPNELVDSNSFYLNIFRWSENTPGNPIYNSVPVKMYFLMSGTTSFLNPNDPVEVLSRQTISQTIGKYGLDDYGITTDNFLASTIVVLANVELQYDALRFRYYDGSVAVGEFDALAPAFSADPNRYAVNHPDTSLLSLHPNWHLRNSGASEKEFAQYTMDRCRSLVASNPKLNQDRLPASVTAPAPKSLWEKITQELSLWVKKIASWFK